MSKINEIRENTVVRSKALLVTVADILENVSKQNLAFAEDVAGFAVSQVRLPAEASDFSDYRERTRNAYSKLGQSLKGYGSDMIEVARDVPGQIKDTLTGDVRPAKPKKAAKTRTKAARKPAAKKTAPRKSSATKQMDEKAEKAAAA